MTSPRLPLVKAQWSFLILRFSGNWHSWFSMHALHIQGASSSIFLIFFYVSPRHSKWNQSSHSSHAIVSMLACCWHIGQTYCMSIYVNILYVQCYRVFLCFQRLTIYESYCLFHSGCPLDYVLPFQCMVVCCLRIDLFLIHL